MRKLKKLSLPPKVTEAIIELVNSLKKSHADIEVYLFGSFAKGTWLEDSDIDLIIVSEYFKNMKPEKRYSYVRNLASRKVPFELLIYTPQEFEKARKKSIVIQDASEYWVKLT